METKVLDTHIRIVSGDIADQDTEAVVTAAHWKLNKGTGTDGTIHSKGGPTIYEECQKIGGCPIGDAVITNAGRLRAKYVIHAVGPVWEGGKEEESALLESAYWRSLEIAAEYNLTSISLPLISTGAFGYPIALAIPVAVKSIVNYIKGSSHIHCFKEIRLVVYPRENKDVYSICKYELEICIKHSIPQFTNNLMLLANNYSEKDRLKVEFSWNGKHAEGFFDKNQQLRWDVIRYCLHNWRNISLLLFRHLFLADAQWAKEAWGVPAHFKQLAEILLIKIYLEQDRGALEDYASGMTSCFDTDCACRGIRLPSLTINWLVDSSRIILTEKTGKDCSNIRVIQEHFVNLSKHYVHELH